MTDPEKKNTANGQKQARRAVVRRFGSLHSISMNSVHGERESERRQLLQAFRRRRIPSSTEIRHGLKKVNVGLLKAVKLRHAATTGETVHSNKSSKLPENLSGEDKAGGRKGSRVSLVKRISKRLTSTSGKPDNEFTINPNFIVNDAEILDAWVKIRYKLQTDCSWMVLGYESVATNCPVQEAAIFPKLIGFGGGELQAFDTDADSHELDARSRVLSVCTNPGWLYWIYARVQQNSKSDVELKSNPTANRFILVAYSKPIHESNESLEKSMSDRYSAHLSSMRKIFQHQLYIHAKHEQDLNTQKIEKLLKDVHEESTLQLVIRTSAKAEQVPFVVRISPEATLRILKEKLAVMLKWDSSEVHVMQLSRKGNLQCLKEASSRNIKFHNTKNGPSRSRLATVKTVTVVHLEEESGNLVSNYRLSSGSKLFVERRNPHETGPTNLEQYIHEGYSPAKDRQGALEAMKELRKQGHLKRQQLLREASQVTGLSKVDEGDLTALYIDSTSNNKLTRHEQLLRHLEKVANDHHTRLVHPEDVIIHTDRPPLGDGRTARVREGLLLFHDEDTEHRNVDSPDGREGLPAAAFHHHRTGEHAVRVAVKMFSCRRVTDAVYAAFEDEVSKLCDLKHPNIVQMLGVFIDNPKDEHAHHEEFPDTVLMILYELMPRGSLKQLRLCEEEWASLPFDNKLEMIIGAAKAIEYLHSSDASPIIHRDIKSDNLLVDDDFSLKWGDFGISRSLKEGRRAQSVVGTSGWVAPEVLLESPRGYGTECDIYSLGVILWEMTCSDPNPLAGVFGEDYVEAVRQGQRPQFSENPPVGCSQEMWERYKALTERCWQFTPSNRPNATAVVNELESIAQLGTDEAWRSSLEE